MTMRASIGRRSRRVILAVGVAIAIWWLVAIPTMQAGAAPTNLSEAEKWVAQQTANGQVADLSQAHPGDRNLRGFFLEWLIVGQIPGYSLTLAGIQVDHAVVSGPLYLPNADIQAEVDVTNSTFNDTVNFQRSRFHHGASFAGSSFNSVYFWQAVFDGSLDLSRASFNATSDFAYAVVHGALDLTNASSKSKDPIDFDAVNVDGVAVFDGTNFASKLEMVSAQISLQMRAENAVLDDLEMTFARIGGTVFLDQTNVHQQLRLDYASIGGSVYLGGITSQVTIPKVVLTESAVSSALELTRLKAAGLFASGLHVGGHARIDDVAISDQADLSNTSFSTLDLEVNVAWPDDPTKVTIKGMSYQSIGGPWEGVLKLIGSAAYDPTAYAKLEANVDRTGDDPASNGVLDAHKSRERDSLWHSGQYVALAASLASWLLENYGRNPERSLLWAVLFVLIGVIVFRPEAMRRVTGNGPSGEAPPLAVSSNPWASFSPLAYSLGVFIPGLRLAVVDEWTPRPHIEEQGWRRLHLLLATTYRRLLALIGWAAAGLAVAVLSGIVPKG